MFSNISNFKYLNIYNISDSYNILSDLFREANDLYVCQKEELIINPNIHNCCNYNYEIHRCDVNYIILYFNEDFTTDNCWYYNIKDKIYFIMNGDELYDDIETAFDIKTDKNFKIYFKEQLKDLSYFLGYNPNNYNDNICINNNAIKNKLISIDLSNLDTSLVTNMNSMFEECNSLEYIDLSKLNTSKVESMDKMFSKCTSLESINFSNLNTSKLKSINFMFSECSSLKSINLRNLDTSLVTVMGYMFNGLIH